MTARRVRIECEQRDAFGATLIDQRSGQAAYFNRGEDTVFELALFQDRRMLQRAEIATLTFKILGEDGVEILTTTYDTTNLSSRLTAYQWRAGMACLIQIRLNPDQSGFLPAGTLTLRVSAMVDGVSAIFASGLIDAVTVPGLLVVAPDPPIPDSFYTKVESDARYDLLGSGSSALALAEELQDFLGFTSGDDPGKFVLFESQSLTADEKEIARTNIGAAVNGGSMTIIGESSGTGNANAIPNGTRARLIVVEPTTNTFIDLRAPVLPVGIPHVLKIKQGFAANWTSDYTFPTNALTCGAGGAGFAKKTWHPATGEGWDWFQLLNDGSSTQVTRLRHVSPPPAVLDWLPESPLTAYSGGSFTRLETLTGFPMGAAAGAPALGAMAGSSFPALVYDGVDDAHSWVMEPFATALGVAVAMVFTATSSTGQKCLFYSTALGIQIVADTDGIRLQAKDASSGTGVLISTSYSSKPVAFVAVIRASGAGAFVLTTDPTGGGQTGSFTPASGTAGGYGNFGSTSAGSRFLACKVGRFQLFRSGLSPDQARAVLDALTEYHQLN